MIEPEGGLGNQELTASITAWAALGTLGLAARVGLGTLELCRNSFVPPETTAR